MTINRLWSFITELYYNIPSDHTDHKAIKAYIYRLIEKRLICIAFVSAIVGTKTNNASVRIAKKRKVDKQEGAKATKGFARKGQWGVVAPHLYDTKKN